MVRDRVIEIFTRALEQGAAKGRWPAAQAFAVDAPRDPEHGDFAVNVAMVLAQAAHKPPRELARDIVEAVRAVDGQGEIASLGVAGPGFINVRLAPDLWFRALERPVAEGENYGRTTIGQGRKVIVEYVSANPTGPLHAGHGRGALVGDGVQSLLRWAGFDVTREYYVNDYGAQVLTLARSVHLRYQELFGRTITMPPKAYPGEYVKEIAARLGEEVGSRYLDAPEPEWLDLFRDRAIGQVLGLIGEDLSAIGIEFDHFTSEKSLYESGTVDRFLSLLEEKGLLYQGKLPPPKSRKGAPPPTEEEGVSLSGELTLFRSSQFGDEVDRPVKKADGTPTYFCADIAYHWEKKRRAEILVDVLGADHGGYVPRLQASLQALGAPPGTLKVVLIQMVNLLRGGEAVKMSKRAGTLVALREVVEEVGRDATRFMFLTRRADGPLDFDLNLAKQQSLDNPVFYVQYGHARLSSIFARAREKGVSLPDYRLEAVRTLTAPAEQDLIRRIVAFPDMLAAAALAYEPHRVAFYLQETIAAFHSYYTRGKKADERILGPDPLRTQGRLYLCRALKQVLANGLCVLGVSAPERMESPEREEEG